MSSSDENDDFSSEDEDFVPNEAEDSEHEAGDHDEEETEKEIAEKLKDEAAKMDTAKKIWEGMKQGGSTSTKSNPGGSKDVASSVKDETVVASKKDKVANGSASAATKDEKHTNGVTAANGSSSNVSESSEDKKDDKIVITKVYDFAGEEVTVKKEVKRDSKEAISHLKHQAATKTAPAKTSTQKQSPLSRIFNSSGLGGGKPGVKRSGGIGNVLGKIGKKPKLSTLEKSKLDWDSFKEEKGIGSELLAYNKGKDGYLEKVSFLQRTDMRQYEHEKALRLGKKS